MKETTIKQLTNLNREFYDKFAASFSASRAKSEPGLEQILQQVKTGDRVLDLGCGQGRIALLLPQGASYLGLDFSEEMLKQAQIRADATTNEHDIRFVVGDLLSDNWSIPMTQDYDWIILRAVLHHIPGFHKRQAILEHARNYLSAKGSIVMANWQFMDIPRLRRRILPWEKIALTAEEVEAGDYLLDWQRDGQGLRYVHLVDENETRQLSQATGFHIKSLFRADGHNNNLTLYCTLTP